MRRRFTKLNYPTFLVHWCLIVFGLSFVSNTKTVAQTNPKIASANGLVPGCVTEEQALNLTINGSNFAAQANQEAKVRIRGTAFPGEVFITPELPYATSQIKIQLPANSVIVSNPGTVTIDVQQLDTDGNKVFSNAVQLPVYPKTGAISGETSVCGNSQHNYSVPRLAGAISYEWSVLSGNATIISGGSISTARIDFNNTAGTVRIGVKTINTCGTTGSTSTLDIQVNAAPEVTLPVFNDVCANAAALPLTSGSPAGGTYTVDGVVATSFDPASAGVGSHTITYYFTQDGCTSSTTQAINVLAAPTVSFPVTRQSICVNAEPVSLSEGLPAGGIFSGPGVTRNTFDPAVAGIGTHTIAYTVTQNGCASSAIHTISVLPVPEVTLPVYSDVCVNATALPLTSGTPAGGTYTVDGVVATSFDPASAGVGSHTITYHLTQDGCTVSASQAVNVIPAPVVSFPLTLQSICVNSEPVSLSEGLSTGGTFSGPGVIMDDEIYRTERYASSADTNFSYNLPLNNGRYMVILHFAEIYFTAPGKRLFDVHIEGNKVLDNYDIFYKAGANTATTETFTVNLNDGLLDIDFIGLTSEGGRDRPKVSAIEVKSTTVPSQIYRINAGGEQVINSIGEFAADNYFSGGNISSTNNPIGGTPAIFDPAIAGVGEHIITYLATQNGCQNSAVQNVSVLDQPLASISAPAGGTQVCQGALVTLTAAPVTDAKYQWLFNDNPIPNAVNNTFIAGESGSYTIQVTNNNCTTVSDPVVVTILAPLSVLKEESPVTFCAGGNTTLHALIGDGYQYQWYKDNVLLINKTNSTLFINEPGNYKVVVTPDGCEPVNSTVVTVMEVPQITDNTITTEAEQIVCSGSTIGITGQEPSGGSGVYTYQWQISTDNSSFRNIADAASQNYTYLTGTFTGSVSFRRVVISGSCSTISNKVSFTVNQDITNNVIAAPAVSTICAESGPGAIIGSTVTGGTDFTYAWESKVKNEPFIVIGGAISASFTPGILTQTTSFRRVVISGECRNISNEVTITVNSKIGRNTIKLSSDVICSGSDPGTITGGAVSGGDQTYSYAWEKSMDGTAFEVIKGITTAGYTPGILTQTTTFRRIVTSGPCTDTSNVVTVNVNDVITGNTLTVPNAAICSGSDPGAITGGAVSGGDRTYSYAWEKSMDGIAFEVIKDITTARYTPGILTQTTTFRRIVTSGPCTDTSNAVTITIEPIATYTVFLTVSSSAFPVCGEATYSAKVIKNVNGINYPTDPRYQQVTWKGGEDVTQQFLFDWWKNDEQKIVAGNTSGTLTLGGLQTEEYYTVRARPISSTLSCVIYNNRPDLTVTGSGSDVLFSNKIFGGQPDGYAVSITSSVQEPICPGTPVTFTAIPTDPGYINQSYQWILNGQDIPGANQPTFTSSQIKDGDVVSVRFNSDENKCNAPITAGNPITMQVRDQIKNRVEKIEGPGKPEVGKPATYLAVPVDNTIDWTYEWTIFYLDGQQETPSETSATLKIASVRADINEIAVKQIAPEGYCVDQNTATISILMEPVAKLAYQSKCDSDTIWFENQSTLGLGIEYLWEFDYQGKTSHAINPVFVYPRTNTIQTFNVKLTVTNTRSSTSAFIIVPIKIYPRLEVKAGNDQVICVDAAAFILTGFAPAEGTWTGKGVSTDGTFDPAFAGVGTHMLTYTVTQDGCTDKAIKTITVQPSLSVNAGSDQSVCIDIAAFSLTGFSPSGGSWSGRGISASGVFTPATAGLGIHTLTYTVVQNGCTNKATKIITVNALPVASAGQDQEICVNAGVFTITGQNPSGGNWSGTGVLPDGKFDPKIAGAGIHELTYTIIQNGCSSQATKKITVTSLPETPKITTSGPVTFCTGSSVELSIAPQANTLYKWQHNGNPVGANNSSLVVKTSGNYTVIAYNNCGEVAGNSIHVTVVSIHIAPQITNASRCGTGKVTLSVKGSGNGNFRWFTAASDGTTIPGEQNSTFTTPAISQTTTYYVSIVTGNCESERVPVQALILPAPVADAGEDQVIRKGEQVLLKGNGGVKYSWSPTLGLSDPAIASPIATPTVTTTYTLTVTSPEGCTSSDEVTIEVLQDIVIPNAFTPNNDGTNDLWIIQNIEGYPDCRIKIYNRWGSLVYESTGYQQSWNGTFNGQELPVTSYFYTIDLKDGRKPLVGHVSIIR